MIFKNSKKELLRLNKLNLKEFDLVYKKMYLIPSGTSVNLVNLKNKETKIFLKRQLYLYPNWKKMFLYLLIKLNIFPSLIVRIPKNIDFVRIGSRIKFFNFNEKEIITFDNNLREISSRKKLKGIMNIPKIKKIRKEYFIDEFIWPYKNLEKEDISEPLRDLFKIYKKTLVRLDVDSIIKMRKERRFFKNIKQTEFDKNKKYLCSMVYGDFWKGNFLKSDKKIYFFDLDNYGKGTIVNDFFKYYLSSSIYSNKINKKMMSKAIMMIMREFKIGKKEFRELIDLESKLWMFEDDVITEKNSIITRNTIFQELKKIKI